MDGNPSAISMPMLQTMLIIASIISATERKRSLNIRYRTISITIPAMGAKDCHELEHLRARRYPLLQGRLHIVFLIAFFLLDYIPDFIRYFFAIRTLFKRDIYSSGFSSFEIMRLIKSGFSKSIFLK